MAFSLDNMMASMAFDKERLIFLHEFMQKFFGEEAVVSRIPDPDLSNLLPITLSQLETDNVHKNRVLFGTLCVSPFKHGPVQTIVEDMQGKACRIIICDVKSSEMGSMFPKGLKVAVKEPFLKTGDDGSQALFVIDPTEIERVAKFPTKVHPRLLKEEGNRLFQAQDWEAAIKQYTLCLEACKISQHKQMMVACLSNRSEAWIKMGSFGRALEDANRALHIDPSHLKSLHRKARALAQLREYKIARSILEDAIRQYPEEQELIDTLNKIVLSDDQS